MSWTDFQQNISLGEHHSDDLFESWIYSKMVYHCLSSATKEQQLFRFSERVSLNISFDELTQKLYQIQSASLIDEVNPFFSEKKSRRFYKAFCWKPSDGFLSFFYDAEINVCHLNGFFSNKRLFNSVSELLKEHSSLIKNKSSINTLAKIGDSFDITHLGFGGIPLETDNYNSNIIDKFNYIINNIGEKNPPGRLSILFGEAGGGKTYFIRGIVDAYPEGNYIIIPPDLIDQLANPQIIPTFINYTAQSYNSLVLILEDADSCLVKRGNDNLSSISSLLNLSDGIIGSSLDIKIIATTNAQKLEIDDALRRPGRLLAELEFESLNIEKSIALFKKMVPEVSDSWIANQDWYDLMLADVYRRVYNFKNNIETKSTKKRKIGFG